MSADLILFIVIIPFFAFIFINGAMQRKAEISLLKYMEQHYKSRWDNITSSGSYNPKYALGYAPKMIRFLLSKEENNDGALLSLKSRVKKHWFYQFVAIVAMPLILIFALVLKGFLISNH